MPMKSLLYNVICVIREGREIKGANRSDGTWWTGNNVKKGDEISIHDVEYRNGVRMILSYDRDGLANYYPWEDSEGVNFRIVDQATDQSNEPKRDNIISISGVDCDGMNSLESAIVEPSVFRHDKARHIMGLSDEELKDLHRDHFLRRTFDCYSSNEDRDMNSVISGEMDRRGIAYHVENWYEQTRIQYYKVKKEHVMGLSDEELKDLHRDHCYKVKN